MLPFLRENRKNDDQGDFVKIQDFTIVIILVLFIKNDNFLSTTGDTLPLLLTIAWIYSVSMLVKDIVQEKEARLKEVMRMMGMIRIILMISMTRMTRITRMIRMIRMVRMIRMIISQLKAYWE